MRSRSSSYKCPSRSHVIVAQAWPIIVLHGPATSPRESSRPGSASSA